MIKKRWDAFWYWYNYKMDSDLPWKVLLGVFGVAAIVVIWLIGVNSIEAAAKWIRSIENPNERAGAYVAIAIVLHAAIRGRSKVEVKP